MSNDYPCHSSESVVLKDPDIRVLGRLSLPNKLNEATNEMDVKRGLVIDVETTGLSQETDEVIQLAGLPFDYDRKSGKILSIHHEKAMVAMRDPGLPISREASLVTGITDEMVTGKSIATEDIDILLSGVDLIIAHNAGFDRPMVEKLWPSFQLKAWACTVRRQTQLDRWRLDLRGTSAHRVV
jgi:DNA polymerase-3 subunit epsilon